MSDSSVSKVVGLKYEPGSGLPKVILKGHGRAAEEILNKKAELVDGPQIVNDEKLLEQLYRLPIDAEIGPDLFQLVAAVLVHVYAVEGKLEEIRR